MTPKGRNETGPNQNLADWVRHHDKYPGQLGASFANIARQLIVESTLLALAGIAALAMG